MSYCASVVTTGHEELDSATVGGGERSFRWKDCLSELTELFWALVFVMIGFIFLLSDAPISCGQSPNALEFDDEQRAK